MAITFPPPRDAVERVLSLTASPAASLPIQGPPDDLFSPEAQPWLRSLRQEPEFDHTDTATWTMPGNASGEVAGAESGPSPPIAMTRNTVSPSFGTGDQGTATFNGMPGVLDRSSAGMDEPPQGLSSTVERRSREQLRINEARLNTQALLLDRQHSDLAQAQGRYATAYTALKAPLTGPQAAETWQNYQDAAADVDSRTADIAIDSHAYNDAAARHQAHVTWHANAFPAATAAMPAVQDSPPPAVDPNGDLSPNTPSDRVEDFPPSSPSEDASGTAQPNEPPSLDAEDARPPVALEPSAPLPMQQTRPQPVAQNGPQPPTQEGAAATPNPWPQGEPKSDTDGLTAEQQGKLVQAMKDKGHELLKPENRPNQIGNRSKGSEWETTQWAKKNGKEVTYCNKYAVDCVTAGYDALGMHDTARQIRQENLGKGKGAMDLAKSLQARGWKVYFYYADTDYKDKPTKNGVEVPGMGKHQTDFLGAKKGRYWGTHVDGMITNFTPGHREWTEAKHNAMQGTDFAVIAALRGEHTAVYSNGKALEVHWDKAEPDELYAKSDFDTWNKVRGQGYTHTGILIVPPGASSPVAQ